MVNRTLLWDPRAVASLRDIFDYLSWRESKSVAQRVTNAISNKAKNLLPFPHKHPLEPNLTHLSGEFRFCVQWSYKIIFEVTDTQVLILDIFHTSRDPKHINPEPQNPTHTPKD